MEKVGYVARMSDDVPAGVGPDLEPSALVIADRRGRIAYWSPGATDLFGYAAEAMVGKAVSVLVPAAFRRRHTTGFRTAWATGVLEASGAVMIPVVCADGETRSYASHIFVACWQAESSRPNPKQLSEAKASTPGTPCPVVLSAS